MRLKSSATCLRMRISQSKMKDKKDVSRYCINCINFSTDVNQSPCKECIENLRIKPNWTEVKSKQQKKNKQKTKQQTFI